MNGQIQRHSLVPIMVNSILKDLPVERSENRCFGTTLKFGCLPMDHIIESCFERADELNAVMNQAGGLLILKGLADLKLAPELFVRLSRAFGPEVENYHQTLTSENFFHDTVPELLVLSAEPPCNHPPPPLPTPRLTETGTIPVQFPQRKEWHYDQSYRRPPPDISLLYAVIAAPQGQGQTLYADCTAAYEALDRDIQRLIEGLNGIHAPSWIGRSESAVRAGESPKTLLPHQYPQKHPLVRIHPDSGRKSLFLCEPKQMDFVEGPIEGMQTGPDGAGARLLYRLLSHATQPCFVYMHEWDTGDLVIGDNRCLLHTATWYDASRYPRVMWRTTVMGNPGKEYLGEEKSWISQQGYAPMHGLETS
ncbi:MAG: TauD/TfdA dioxygenase family protein [bacterium]